MRRWLAPAALVALALGVLLPTAETEGGIFSDRSRQALDEKLHTLAGDPDEYMRPKLYEKKAAVVLVFDDGYKSFPDRFVTYSDHLWATKRQRVRGTVPVSPYWLDGNGNADIDYMTWNDMRYLNGRQADFELCLHGAATGAGEVFGFRSSGFSRSWMDSSLADMQYRMALESVLPARSMVEPTNRHAPGMESVWIANGIYNVAGLAVPTNFDSTGAGGVWGNERTFWEVNSDPWPPSSSGSVASGNWAYQRYGGIQNRWNVGRRTSFTYPENVDSLKKVVDLAIQTETIAIFTFHDIQPDTLDANLPLAQRSNLHILEADLQAFMDYIADKMEAGALESLTLEQAVARGTGRVYGELLNRNNFACLTDFAADSTDSAGMVARWPRANRVPIGWPMNQANRDYYLGASGVDTLKTRSTTAADSTHWKVWQLGVPASGWPRSAQGDTILAHFTDESIADSVSYAGSSPDGRILIAASDGSYSPALPIIVCTEGVWDDEVQITVTAMVDNAVGDGYIAARLFQYRENDTDILNTATGAYDFHWSSVRQGAQFNINNDLTTNRLVPQFYHPIMDTTLAYKYMTPLNLFELAAPGDTLLRTPATGWHVGNNDLDIEPFMLAEPTLRPYVFDHAGAIDFKAPFGEYFGFTVSGGVKDIGTKIEFFDGADVWPSGGEGTTYGEAAWRNFTFSVPIDPGKTDWIGGYVYLSRLTSWTGSPTVIIANVSAVAGAG